MSDNEEIKRASRYLRGTIAEELAQPTPRFVEENLQLLKFHGSYQQENRDERQARKAAGLEKAYSFMVRSRIPGGVLTAQQYLAHDEIAHAYGNATLRFTTRQGIQLHGVLKGALRETIRSINDSLLSTLAACGDVNRNVMACPAPVHSRAQAHVQSYAHRLAMHLAPRSHAYHEIWLDGEKLEPEHTNEHEPIYGPTYLPRKFKIGVAYAGDNCIDVFTQDLGFVAEVDGDTLVGFTVLVGGGMGSTHGKTETYPRLATPLGFVPPEAVLDVAEAVITVFRDFGDRTNRKHARLKYVVEERGIAWFREQVETRLGQALDDPHTVTFHDVDDHLGWHEAADGTWFLGVYVENGRVADRVSALLRSGIRAVVNAHRCGVRITGQQNVLLTGIAAEARADVESTLRAHGVQTDPATLGLSRHAMACPALPTCGLAVAEAERALPDLVREIERDVAALGLWDVPLSIRMTGCPNGCARPRMGDIGIVGRSRDIYDLFIGGDFENTRLNTVYAQGVARDAIAATLRPALEYWQHQRFAGERFGDFAHRFGLDRLREAATELNPA